MTTAFLRAAAAAAPATAVATLALTGLLDLPLGPVTADTQSWRGPFGTPSTVEVVLSNVPAGFDVANGQYDGWCIEDNHQDNAPNFSQVTLYDTSAAEAELPLSLRGRHWDKVNYLLNHRTGQDVVDVQVALWVLVDYFGGSYGPPSPAAEQLISDANTFGVGFVPGPTDVVGVVLFNDGIGPNGVQDTLIEVRRTGGGEGLTPGYWKNHLRDWVATGLSPCDDFDTVFGVDFFSPDITLFQAVWRGGGGVNKAARHGTAALLNALHPEVDYPYSAAQVLAFVQAGNIEPLVVANELGCGPLTSSGPRPRLGAQTLQGSGHGPFAWLLRHLGRSAPWQR